MPRQSARTKSVRDRFWGRFAERSEKQGVREASIRWYVIRAERYLKAFRDKKLRAHSAADVAGYLKSVGEGCRSGRLTDWQFRQTVDAIQNLWVVGDVAAAREVDWGHWRDSARLLAADHPTIARAQGTFGEGAGPGADAEHPTRSGLELVRAGHREVLERLVSEIRRRKYSIRTEQTYAAWVCRFIGFCGGRDPLDSGAEDVVAFLGHLAVRRNVAASTRNQALNAVVFLIQTGVGAPLG